jgi:hypothetical protein
MHKAFYDALKPGGELVVGDCGVGGTPCLAPRERPLPPHH